MDHAKDEELPHRYIIKLAFLLAPSRAINQLRSLAKGHALSQGRNYITIEDIYIVVHTVFSTASIERETIFELLIAHEGSLTTSQITESLNVAKPTTLRTMTELKAIGLVDVNINDSYNAERRIILKDEFGWFLTPEFQTCKEKSAPRKQNNFEHPYEGDKFLYRCQYCDYKTYFLTEYDRHTVFKHPRKAGYNKRVIFDIKYLGHLTAQDCFKIFPGEMFENIPIEELNII